MFEICVRSSLTRTFPIAMASAALVLKGNWGRRLHSYRKAAIGSSRAALDAGSNPKRMPVNADATNATAIAVG